MNMDLPFLFQKNKKQKASFLLVAGYSKVHSVPRGMISAYIWKTNTHEININKEDFYVEG